MIDIETKVFDQVYSAIGSLLPAGCLVSEYVPVSEKLPFVTLVEIANVMYRKGQDNRIRENYAVIAYEANVYAKKKDECRTLASALDEAMVQMQFERLTPGMQFIPNIADPSFVRINVRYEAVTDGERIFRNH